MSKGQGKLLTKIKSRHINKTSIKVCFLRAYLGCPLNPVAQKLYLCRNIFLSQYFAQKYLVCNGPNMKRLKKVKKIVTCVPNP